MKALTRAGFRKPESDANRLFIKDYSFVFCSFCLVKGLKKNKIGQSFSTSPAGSSIQVFVTLFPVTTANWPTTANSGRRFCLRSSKTKNDTAALGSKREEGVIRD